MYKETISSKIGLRKKFPRLILYTKQNVVGLGLISPKTVITILAMKLYIGNKRERIRIGNMINIIDKIIFIENSKEVSKNNYQSLIRNTKIQNEYINKLLNDRNLTIINNFIMITQIIQNRTIIDYMY